MNNSSLPQVDNFPVGHTPNIVSVTPQQFADLFHEIDALRALLDSDEARAALARIELRIEDIAGV